MNQREAIGCTSRSSTLVAPDRDMKQAVRQVQYDLGVTYFVCLNLYDVYSIRVILLQNLGYICTLSLSLI